MFKKIGPLAVLAASMTIAACGTQNHAAGESPFGSISPVSPSAVAVAPMIGAPAPTASASVGGTLRETLTGAPIGGVSPEGQALADETRFQSGGDTILTVQIRKVNLPDGTALAVSLDFTPVGTITLSRGEGAMTANLGHFGVSRDQVRVKNGSVTVLSGAWFQ